MKVTLEEVAQKAHVSIATVSRVLNGHAVREETRQRVEEAIVELEYRPNLTARGLSMGTSNMIGVVVSNMENPYFASIMNAIEQRFRLAGYLCTFASSEVRGDEDEITIIKRFLDSGVDGLIIVDVGERGELSRLYAELNAQLPVVIVNGDPDRTDTNLVIMDQERGMHLMMDHLFSLGHRDIAFVRGARRGLSFDTKERVFHQRIREQEISIPEDWVIRLDTTDHYDSIDLMARVVTPILAQSRHPSAIFTSNEIMALGVLRAARALRIAVPAELSVAAQDNTILGQFSDPALTTIDMAPAQLGTEAALMLLQLLHHPQPPPRRLVFFPSVIVRGSTAPHRANGA